MPNHLYRTWVEISKSAIKNNYQSFRKILKPQTKLLAVVKSNAYGHELMGFSKELANLGVDFLGVDSITEAQTLRREGIKKPILVLGHTLPVHFGMAASGNISITISSFENLDALKISRKKVAIHLKVDTGMHRQGFFLDDLKKVCAILKSAPAIKLEGMFTHFAGAKKPDSHKDTERQIKCFEQAISAIKAEGFKPIFHAAATAGTLNYPKSHFDMVRVGIGLYGLWPSSETKITLEKKIKLIPALTWKTIISELKWVEKGGRVGYDYTETLKRKTRLAVLPIGYWQGFWRSFSSKADVLIDGRRCKLIGRVSMDMVVVDVTDIKNVRVGDEVVLIGKQGKEEITAEELAGLAGTTNYEIVTKLNPLMKKIYN